MVQADRLRIRPAERNEPRLDVATMSVHTRGATVADAAAIAKIYNEGIEDGLATFETEPRTPPDVEAWFDNAALIVVAELDGRVVAWASATPYRPDREAYAGVAEFSVYVAREARARGVGRATLGALIDAAETAGLWKLLSRIFPENEASLALCRSSGFREAGLYRRHAKLHGAWRDCVIVERLLGEAAEP
jgi:phosphinothricin acetyltransferase